MRVGLLVLVFTLAFMIPLSNTVFAKPVFDKTSVGITCNGLWDEIKALKDKKAKQDDTLNDPDSSALGRAESNYNETCASWYGPERPNIPKMTAQELLQQMNSNKNARG